MVAWPVICETLSLLLLLLLGVLLLLLVCFLLYLVLLPPLQRNDLALIALSSVDFCAIDTIAILKIAVSPLFCEAPFFLHSFMPLVPYDQHSCMSKKQDRWPIF